MEKVGAVKREISLYNECLIKRFNYISLIINSIIYLLYL